MKPNSFDGPLIRGIAMAYAGLGPRPRGVPSGLGHFHCPRWRNAATSPVWPLTKTVTRRQLDGLERYFVRRPKRHPFDDAGRCYLSVLQGRGGHDVRSIGRVARAAGWKRRERTLTLDVWLRPLALDPPSGYSVRFARLRRSAIHSDFMALTRANFRSSARFLRELEAMFKGIESNTFEVVFYSKGGKPAAAGLVTTGGSGGYFFCGSVAPHHRGRGLWRALVAARQWLSKADGARYWAASTKNPRIAGKCDRAFGIVTFWK